MKLSELVAMMSAVSTFEEALSIAVAFTHVDDQTKLSQTFAIGVMERSAEIQALEVVSVPVDQKFARFMARSRGVEAHRLAPLLEIHPAEYPPILAAIMPPMPHHPIESHLIIDGTHRYVAAAMQGAETILARVVPEVIWRKYLIEDVPVLTEDEVLSMPSGMSAGGGVKPEALATAVAALNETYDDKLMHGLVDMLSELEKKLKENSDG